MALWTPLNLSDLRLWLDSADAATITGSPVSTWTDKSSAGIVASGSAVYWTNSVLNNRMMMYFQSSANSKFTLSPAIDLSTFSRPAIFIVFYRNTPTNVVRMLGSDARNKAPFVVNLDGTSLKTAITATVLTHNACGNTAGIIGIYRPEGSSLTQIVDINSDQFGYNSGLGNPAGSVYYLGFALPDYSDCYIGDVIVCDNPTNEDLLKIRGYLAHKFGYQASWLYQEDPYFTEPPTDFSLGTETDITTKGNINSELLCLYKQPQPSLNEVPWLKQLDNEAQVATSISWKSTSADQPSAVLPESLDSCYPVVTINRVYTFGGGAGGSTKIYTAPIAQDGKIGPWVLDPLQVPVNASWNYDSIWFVTSTRIYLIKGNTVYYASVKADGTISAFAVQGTTNESIGLYNRAFIHNNVLYITGGYLGSYYNRYTKTTISDGVINHTGFSSPVYTGATIDQRCGLFATKKRLYYFGSQNAYPARSYWTDISDDVLDGTFSYVNYVQNGFFGGIAASKTKFYTFSKIDLTYGSNSSAMTVANISDGAISGSTTAGNVPTFRPNHSLITTSAYLYDLVNNVYDNWAGGANSFFSVYQELITGDIRSLVPKIDSEVESIAEGTSSTDFVSPVPVLNSVIDNPLEQFYNLEAPLAKIESFIPVTPIEISASVESPSFSFRATLWRDTDPSTPCITGTPWTNLYNRASLPDTSVIAAPTSLGAIVKSFWPVRSNILAVTNKKIYVFGGYLGTQAANNLVRIDLNVDGTFGDITEVMDLSPYISDIPAVCYTKNRLLVISGTDYDNNTPSRVWSFEINSDGTLGDIVEQSNPGYDFRYPQLVVIDNHVVLTSGTINGISLYYIFIAPIDKFGFIGQWTQIPSLSLPNVSKLFAFAGKLYACPSYSYTIKYVEYDETGILSSSWSNLPDIPAQVKDWLDIIISSNYIHFMQGSESFGATIDVNGDIGSWSSLFSSSSGYTSCVVPNYLYSFYLTSSGGATRIPWPEGYLNYTDQLEQYIISGDIISQVPKVESELDTNVEIVTVQGDIKSFVPECHSWVGVTQFWSAEIKSPLGNPALNLAHDFPQPFTYVCGNPWVQQSKFNSSVLTLTKPFTLHEYAFPYLKYNWGRPVVTNKRVYYMGGLHYYDTNLVMQTLYDTILYADINDDGLIGPWITYTGTMPAELRHFELLLLRNKLYLFGGYDFNSGTAQTTIFVSEVSEDGQLGPWSIFGNMPLASDSFRVLITKDRVTLFIDYDNYTCKVFSANIQFDGTFSLDWEQGPNAPIKYRELNITVFEDRLWVEHALYDPAYECSIDESGRLGTWSISTDARIPYNAMGRPLIATKNYIYAFGVDYNRAAPIYSDGSRGPWSIIEPTTSSDFYNVEDQFFALNGKIYMLYGSYTMYSTDFLGGVENTLESGFTFIEDEFNTITPPAFKAPKAQIYADVTVQNFEVFPAFPYPNGIPWQDQWDFNTEQNGVVPTPTQYGYSFFDKFSESDFIITKRKIFAIGGHIGGYGIGAIWSNRVYLGELDSLKQIQSWSLYDLLPVSVFNHKCFSTKSFAYIVGGLVFTQGVGIEVSYTIYAAPIDDHGDLGTFVAVGTIPDIVYGQALAVYDGRVYSIGGLEYSGGEYWASNACYSAPINEDGTLGNWRSEAYYPIAIVDPHAIITNGILHVFGGYDAGGEASTTQCYKAYINPTTKALNPFSAAPSLVHAVDRGVCVCSKNTVNIIGGSNRWFDGHSDHTDPVLFTQTANINGAGLAETWGATSLGLNLFDAAYGILEDTLFIVGSRISMYTNSPEYTNKIYTAPFIGGSPNYTQYAWYTETYPDIAINTKASISAEVGGPLQFNAPKPSVNAYSITPMVPIGNYVVKKCIIESHCVTASVQVGDIKSLVPQIDSELTNDNIIGINGDISSYPSVVESSIYNPIRIAGQFVGLKPTVESYGINFVTTSVNYVSPVPQIRTFANPIQIDVNIKPPKVQYFAWDYEAVAKLRISKPIIRATTFDVICKIVKSKPIISSWTEEAAGQLVGFKPTINSTVESGDYFFSNIKTKAPKLSTTFGDNTMFETPRAQVNSVAHTYYVISADLKPRKPDIFSSVLVGKFMVGSVAFAAPIIQSQVTTPKFMSGAINSPIVQVNGVGIKWLIAKGSVQVPNIKLDSFISLQNSINTVLYSNFKMQGSMLSHGALSCGIRIEKPRIKSDFTPDLMDSIIRFNGDLI